jgi:hypothetical protein
MQTKVSATNSEKTREIIVRQWHRDTLVLFVCMIAMACLLVSKPVSGKANDTTASSIASQTVDPNKSASEFNHHIAGWVMIGIGLLALAALLSPGFKFQKYLWPLLFILGGLFLAIWSDAEIWPRGNLSWAWLFQHDAEARQHKIYSLLLIALGIVEYIRVRGLLPRFWKIWAFPVIAILGAGMLLIHDHGAGSGADSPEAQDYLVNPKLDVDGNPRDLIASNVPANSDNRQNEAMSNPMNHSTGDAGYMPMDHSHMNMDMSAAPHHHVMTPSMVRIERQHLWFVVIGLAIAVFKFISDSELFRHRLIPWMWPSCTMLLGLMLVFYRE